MSSSSSSGIPPIWEAKLSSQLFLMTDARPSRLQGLPERGQADAVGRDDPQARNDDSFMGHFAPSATRGMNIPASLPENASSPSCGPPSNWMVTRLTSLVPRK